MKGLLHALLELSLVALIVAVVWKDPAPIAAGFAKVSVDEQLLVSSWVGDDEQFDDALRRGASIAARDSCGMMPLHYAAASGDAYLVRRLLALGADVDAVSNGGITALVHAAMNDHADVVEILLRAGARRSEQALDAAIFAMADRAEQVLRRWRTMEAGAP